MEAIEGTEAAGAGDGGRVEGTAEAGSLSLATIAEWWELKRREEGVTVSQWWRLKRDLAMASVALQGASVRFLGEVFDVDPSRVSRILVRLRVEFGAAGGLTEANVRDAMRRLGKDCRQKRLSLRRHRARLAAEDRGRKSAPTEAQV